MRQKNSSKWCDLKQETDNSTTKWFVYCLHKKTHWQFAYNSYVAMWKGAARAQLFRLFIASFSCNFQDYCHFRPFIGQIRTLCELGLCEIKRTSTKTVGSRLSTKPILWRTGHNWLVTNNSIKCLALWVIQFKYWQRCTVVLFVLQP